ncbi:hypothetical protein PLAN_40137 [Planktothrix rubescens CCAP 1459/22]|uniref:Uncharacterized protein n=1 Tax=Planktothrix rubescens CCAP 1459/22 TaxID=329571 RepID=A0A6J7ZMM1_PLARU|nr:hypothetical protein PLAN_40137 [Planktothrix rubescens NIVA-CYA 18]
MVGTRYDLVVNLGFKNRWFGPESGHAPDSTGKTSLRIGNREPAP